MDMPRRALLSLTLLHALPGIALRPALARADMPPFVPPPEIALQWPQAHLQGQGRLTFLGMHIYDARLWVGPAFQVETLERQGFALELVYGRSLDGQRIAERSLAEMKKIGPMTEAQAARWLARMAAIFPDVEKNDRITGMHRPGEPMRFFLNGRPRGDVADPEFAMLFFGIWLSARSPEPKLRLALLGATSAQP